MVIARSKFCKYQTQVYILCTPFYCTVIDSMHTGMSCWKVVKYDKHIVSGSCDDDIMLVLTRLKTHWSCIYTFQQSSFSYRRWLRESREREREGEEWVTVCRVIITSTLPMPDSKKVHVSHFVSHAQFTYRYPLCFRGKTCMIQVCKTITKIFCKRPLC